MKTIGEYLKEHRVKKRFSFAKIGKETKIKKEFLKAIENEDWENLPEYPVVQGFIKKVARSLSVNEKQAIALLRRDYPPKKISISPKPDISKEFRWSPKLTFLIGVGLAILAILSYLGHQYYQFVQPPVLEVDSPREGAILIEATVEVIGRTDQDATLRVNNQPVLVSEDGDFQVEIEISESTKEIEVVAKSRSGKETIIRRNISVMSDE